METVLILQLWGLSRWHNVINKLDVFTGHAPDTPKAHALYPFKVVHRKGILRPSGEEIGTIWRAHLPWIQEL